MVLALDNTKAFFTPSARSLIKRLSTTYDIWFVTLEDEKDLYKAIRKAPLIDLLILSGHGTQEELALNAPVEGYHELSYIDINDKELKRHLKKLAPNATIFLNSCNTAKGGKEQKNLANKISEFAPGRLVIASMEPFSINEVVINQIFPLDMAIGDKTYITKK